jgi:hypothetical protein
MKRITREIDLVITPEEAAMAFIYMDDEEQAIFLNVCAEESKSFKNGLEFQISSISGNPILTKNARFLMKVIGEYSESV